MALKQFPETDWDQAITLAGELVKIKSTSTFSENQKILDYVYDYLDGVHTRIIMPKDAPPYLMADVCCPNPEFKLIFSGHLDTVEEGVMHNPFSPVIRGGTLLGRGAADMKAGCAAMMFAIKEFSKIESRKGDVCLIFTLDEEIGSLSMEHAIGNELPPADMAIIGEPSGLSLIVSHKGSQWIKVTFHGKSCHASTPHEGSNAVVMASMFIGIMEKYLREQFAGRYHPLCGLPTVNVGTIRGGHDCPNVVPDYCEIMVDRRWNPNETLEQVWQDIRHVFGLCKGQNSQFKATLELMGEGRVYPPLDFSRQTRLLEKLTMAISAVGFSQVRRESFSGWTEGALLEKAGIPAVVFGPGDFKKAHTLEECVVTDQIVQAARAYLSILLTFCA